MADLFREGLDSRSFQIVARLIPPKSPDFSSTLDMASSWKGMVGAILVADNPSANMGASSLVLADRLRREGHDVILTLSCRDRNRMGLGSTALGAAAASLKTIVCVSGDYPHLGDHPDSKPVYDLDSVQLLSMLRQMKNGRDLYGNPLDASPSFFLGAAVCPAADPLLPQLMKARKKASAGAEFFITLPIFSRDQLDPFLDGVQDLPVKILVGVMLPSFAQIDGYWDGSIPGTFIPEDLVGAWRDGGEEAFASSSVGHVKRLIEDLKSSGRVAGICISASEREAEIAALLQQEL